MNGTRLERSWRLQLEILFKAQHFEVSTVKEFVIIMTLLLPSLSIRLVVDRQR